MAVKYYAVKEGKIPGVYQTWEECKEQVLGFSGARYKSFKTLEEAENFIRKEEVASEKESIEEEAVVKEKTEEESLVAYVDGSFVEGKKFGSGCVLLYQNKVIDEISIGFVDEEFAKMRNVAGEIKASELAIRYAIENAYKSIVVYHDYEGIAKWCLGEWKTNKEGTKAYKAFYDEASKKIQITFKKVRGHSGDLYNELADSLAKKAIL